MKIGLNYGKASSVQLQERQMSLHMSRDEQRAEKVRLRARLRNPLLYRDAMLMLREIVVMDLRMKKKPRGEFFAWLSAEVERRMLQNRQYQEDYREELQEKIKKLRETEEKLRERMRDLEKEKRDLQREGEKTGAWSEYQKIEKEFWKFLYERDRDLWFVLDPVITVHQDRISFEAFSMDESSYACLSIPMQELELQEEPSLGTTNIDFSASLATGLERFRSYQSAELCILPEGFAVQSGGDRPQLEKKIDLPETWIRGFNQVSGAASLQGIEIELSPADVFDILGFLKRHKDKKEMPRYMKWILSPGEPVKIRMEPFDEELTLHAVYRGKVSCEEKLWGRRRWLVLEKLLPIARSFRVKILGFAMPQFILADLGGMSMTVGFTPWSSIDWAGAQHFSILSGYLGEGCYPKVKALLAEHRALSFEDCCLRLSEEKKASVRAGIGMLFRRGEAYYDWAAEKIRFRLLLSEELPKELYEVSELEKRVMQEMKESKDSLRLQKTKEGGLLLRQNFPIRASRNVLRLSKDAEQTQTEIRLGGDRQIEGVQCSCKEFHYGSRNLSEPCAHILALYAAGSKFFLLDLPNEREHSISDVMEVLL